MTAPNPARDATPGQRFTDPDGGTWVRLRDAYSRPWLQVTASGAHYWRSQEEAEAAGLVPLEAPRDPGESGLPHWQEELLKAAADVVIGALCPGGRVIETPDGTRLVLTREFAATAPLEQWKRDVLSAAEVCSVDEPGPHIVETGGYRLRIDRADYPAPLDPGNPEHLRQVANLIEAMAVARDWEEPDRMKLCPLWIREEAERIDRQHAKAEQEAADRKRAQAAAREAMDSTPEGGDVVEVAALIALRAERARTEEAKP